MTKNKLIILIVVLCTALSVHTQIFADYTGPNAGARRYDYVCGSEPCNCSMGCGGEDTGGTHYDEGSGTECSGNSPQVFCESCDVHCTANYPDAEITLTAMCSTGFGKDGWCRGDVTVTATGVDNQYKITGFENSDGTRTNVETASSSSTSFTFSGEQLRTVEFWAHSGLGDTSSKATYEVKIDLTDPVNYIEYSGTLSDQNWYKGPVVITSKAVDTFLDFTKVNPQHWPVVFNSFTTPDNFSGSVTPQLYTEDLAGNHAGWDFFETIYIDNDPPRIKSLFDPLGKWYSTPLPLFVLGEDDHSGVLTGYIFVDGQDIGARGNASSASHAPAEGMHTVKYQLEDRANNKSAETGEYSFGYDITPPVVKLDSNQSFDIVGVVVTVSGTVTDNLSGVKSVEIKYGKNGAWIPVTGQPATGTTDGTWSHTMTRDTAEGFNMFYVRTTDIAGNYSSGTELTFTLNRDYTAPETIGMRTEGTKGEGGVYRGVVTFIGEAEDSVAGVKSIFVDLGLGSGEKQNQDNSPAGFTGTVNACVRAVDNVDNSTECIKQDGVLIDNTKPYIKSIDTLDTSKVYGADAVFSATGADDHAGMYSVTISVDGTPFTNIGDSHTVNFGALGDGTHVITIELKDNAGNTLTPADDSSLTISGIVTDGTKPSVSISKPTDGTYAKDTLEIAGTVTDNIGVDKAIILIDGTIVKEYGPYNGTTANISDSIDISSLDEGTHTIELIAYDKAGNVSDTASATFIIDRTAPTVSVQIEGVKGDGGVYRGQVTFIGKAEDTGVGVKDIFVDLGNGQKKNSDKSSEGFSGEITSCVRAVDMLGNDSGCINQNPVLIDNTKPYPVSYTDVSKKTVFVEGDTFEVTGKDDHSGMYSVVIVVDGESVVTTNGEPASIELSTLGDGTHVIEFLLTDNAGNVYNSADDPNVRTGFITIDTTGPVVTVSKPSSGDYAKDTVHIEGSAEDNIGLKKAVISVDGNIVKEIPLTGTKADINTDIDTSSLSEGEHTITIQAFDQGDNPSEPVVIKINIDRTAPTVSIETEGVKGDGGVYRGAVKFIGKAEDTGAGVADIFVDIGSGEKKNSDTSDAGYSGLITACVRAVDKVGNDSGCINQEPVLVDNEKPFPTSYTDLTEKIVFTADDVFEVKGDDNHSGMYSVTIVLDDQPVSTKNGDTNNLALSTIEDGEHTIEFLLTDNAGNIYNSADDPNVNTGKIVIDKTGPELTVEKPENEQVVGDSVNVIGSAVDNIGLGKAVISIDGTPVKEVPLSGKSDDFDVEIDTTELSEGKHVVSVQAFDQGNNPSNIEERTINVDHTPPVCHIEVYGERGAGGYFRGEITLVTVCEDNGQKMYCTGPGSCYMVIEKHSLCKGAPCIEKVVIPSDFTGEITPKPGGIDEAGNDSGPQDANPIHMPDGTPIDKIMVDNNPPHVTDYFMPSRSWVKVDYLDMFVEGEDEEGPLYSGSIIVNKEENVINTENDRSELRFNMDEGISSLQYYVVDLAGNVSETVGSGE